MIHVPYSPKNIFYLDDARLQNHNMRNGSKLPPNASVGSQQRPKILVTFAQKWPTQNTWSPVVYEWGQWGQYGSCSRRCGGGVQYRQRLCVRRQLYGYGGNRGNQQCYGPSSSQRRCNLQCCPGKMRSVDHTLSYSLNNVF